MNVVKHSLALLECVCVCEPFSRKSEIWNKFPVNILAINKLSVFQNYFIDFFEMLKRATLCYIMTYKDFTFHFLKYLPFWGLKIGSKLHTSWMSVHLVNSCSQFVDPLKCTLCFNLCNSYCLLAIRKRRANYGDEMQELCWSMW